jgi:hypothetical protein
MLPSYRAIHAGCRGSLCHAHTQGGSHPAAACSGEAAFPKPLWLAPEVRPGPPALQWFADISEQDAPQGTGHDINDQARAQAKTSIIRTHPRAQARTSVIRVAPDAQAKTSGLTSGPRPTGQPQVVRSQTKKQHELYRRHLTCQCVQKHA